VKQASQGLMVATLVLFAAAPLPAAQVGGSSATRPTAETTDSTTNTATLKLVAGRPGEPSRLTLNGQVNGSATLVVPPGAHVVLHFVNEDSIPHSAVVIPEGESMLTSVQPSIPGATTKEATRRPTHAMFLRSR
jgi:hypothetical protein